jgi:hypothetical protein
MAALLDDLDELAEAHPEVLDSDVRERMWEVVQASLIRQVATAQIPSELGMFTPEGNEQLHDVLAANLARLRETFAVFRLDTPAKRLASFHNPKLRSARGSSVEHYFGHP